MSESTQMDHDLAFMQRALQLAENGLGTTSPNPMVGCVIVHENRIIGEGFTSPYGGPHAEVNAVNSVADHDLLTESTLYVTLEPCAHFGKTPPCADLLVRKNVKRVVIACLDPFDQVDGRGIQKLEQGGIDVTTGILEQESRWLNRRFFTSVIKKRPYIILKWAQTSDGFIARENYDSKWISNPYSRQLVHKWRAEEDAILVGKNTGIQDNPSLTVRDWTGENPTRILLDKNLEVKENADLFDGSASTFIFNENKAHFDGHNRWVPTELSRLMNVLSSLHENKISSLIVEGGTQVLNSFIKEGCWDEARVFTSPNSFGKGIPSPTISGKIIEQEDILGDKLITYTNSHG